MLKFERNKVVGVEKKGEALIAHGFLDDDIYSLQMDVIFNLPDLKILSIEGKWNRWTTPECPRAVSFLQEAVGMCVYEQGFSQKVHKIVGRKACRHFANLLLECSHSAKEAVLPGEWGDKKADSETLPFEAFVTGASRDKAGKPGRKDEIVQTADSYGGQKADDVPSENHSEGMVIDLHVHTSPASPCSSAPLEKIIEEAKKIGLDGICLTDHNFVWDGARLKDLRRKFDFLILRGNEIITDQGDMIVFGLDRDVQGIIKLEELKKEVADSGGVMIVAHPFRGFLTFGVGQLGLTPERAMERPLFKHVDAVEVMNGKVTERENAFASMVSEGLSLPSVGGSDAHEVHEVGKYATRFTVPVKDEESLIEGIKQGKCVPVAYRREGA